ncbi:ParB N-terminal domain-containing protein [Acetoanaerobium noterae]|uniref:ParB N-terminal domain-containing protein n=1 Tax=Acetoanaerobium noterae TaxID=745369 RepID=UPI0032423A9F
MKMNAPRRKLMTDAIDLLTEDYEKLEETGFMENRVVSLDINQIKPFHDHPFHLYEGDRLQVMVESIRTNGILTPVIVRRQETGDYEMLAGHNRMNAAQIAGLEKIPAIVKTGLTEEEALLYVVETNLIQRSFSDMYPSEQATVLAVQYERLVSQGRRNDILKELQILEENSTRNDEKTSGLIGQKLDSRGRLAKEYNLSSRSVARLLRINDLIPAYKAALDNGLMPLYVAVDISYLPMDSQGWLYDISEELGFRLSLKNSKLFREVGEDLTAERIREIIMALLKEKAPTPKYQTVKLSSALYSRYFKPNHQADEIEKIIEHALALYYAKA